jgi:endogenous inhibitor of DNA gyrase (YacG/DUF329 family)
MKLKCDWCQKSRPEGSVSWHYAHRRFCAEVCRDAWIDFQEKANGTHSPNGHDLQLSLDFEQETRH